MKPHLEEAQRSLKVADRDIAALRVLTASTAVCSTRRNADLIRNGR
jgi:hypothetical protein